MRLLLPSQISSCLKIFRSVGWILIFLLSSTFLLVCYINSHWFKRLDTSCLSSEAGKSVLESEQRYTEHIAERDELIRDRAQERLQVIQYVNPYEYFPALFECPYSVQRIGGLGDGGKWVCGLERYKASSCVIYSFGIGTEISFEVEMLRKSNCEIFAFDGSISSVRGVPIKHKGRFHFSKLYGGDEDSVNFTTLGEAMKRNGHTHIDILKMDIEQYEYVMFLQIIQQYKKDLPFSQLLMEIHGVFTDVDTFTNLHNMMLLLERSGLRPFRNELNIALIAQAGDFKHSLCEYSFLNTKKLC